jgi:DNA-binding response OmpR family regulator
MQLKRDRTHANSKGTGGIAPRLDPRKPVLLLGLRSNESSVFAFEALRLGLSPVVRTITPQVLRSLKRSLQPFVPEPLIIVGENSGREPSIALCRRVREMLPAARIIYQSAKIAPSSSRQVMDMGASISYACEMRAHHVLDELYAFARVSRLTTKVGALAIQGGRATIAGRTLRLTKTEFAILAYLIALHPRIMTKEDAKAAAAMPEHCGARNVEWHVHNIRKKINPAEPQDTVIRVIWGKGWALDAEWRPPAPSNVRPARPRN